MELPAVFADVTAGWVESALALNGVRVDSVDVDPMDSSKGLIGDLAVLRIAYSAGNGPSTLVLKLPAASADSRSIGEMLNAYGREVAFYREVAPRSPGARLPRCYFAGEDLIDRRWALLLEEVPADPFDFLAGATTAQADAAVDALADFHAMWWESDERFAWMPGFDSTGGVGGLQSLWLANLPVFVERYGPSLPGQTADWVLAFAPRLADWSAKAANEPLTMVHSDYRLDNLLFTGGDVTMIDWQTAMRAPAAMDLSCFLATSLSHEVRQAEEHNYIDRYLERLGQTGAAVDEAWFRRSYDENLLWWMGQFGNNLAHLSPGNESVADALRVMVERVYGAGLEHDVARLL